MTDVTKSIWIDAPPEVVFRYLTEAELTARWSGLRAELDPVPGGRYRLDMGLAGVMEGKFLTVEPAKFVSFEVYGPEGADAPASVIEIAISPEADGSRVEVRQTGLTAPFDRMAARGWDHHLARLSVAAQGGTPAPDSLCERSLESLQGA